MAERWDVVIIGGGPAGLAAAIYASRARLRTLLLEWAAFGGQISVTDRIENYPGFPEGIGGMELAAKMKAQAEKFGTQFQIDTAQSIERTKEGFLVKGSADSYACRSVIVAVGSKNARLGAPGEAKFFNKGVSYCALCDGAFFADQPVAVVGGGDSALSEALFLTRTSSKVYLIHRRDQFRAEKILVERARAEPKIEMVLDSVVESIDGKQTVDSVTVKNIKTGKAHKLAVKGIFVYVGMAPQTDFLKGLIKLDERGSVVTDSKMATNVAGIWAAGDCRSGALRQITTSVSDGTIAALQVEEWLSGKRKS